MEEGVTSGILSTGIVWISEKTVRPCGGDVTMQKHTAICS